MLQYANRVSERHFERESVNNWASWTSEESKTELTPVLMTGKVRFKFESKSNLIEIEFGSNSFQSSQVPSHEMLRKQRNP